MEKGIQTLLGNYVSIYERPKKKCSKHTDEENAERARTSTIKYYFKNIEKRERKRVDNHNKKYRLNKYLLVANSYFLFKH